jgi:hypothetical protein
MDNSSHVVITVPHSLCVSGLDHLCDYMAPKAAVILSNKMNAKLFLADANRIVIDYNRRSSRSSNWRTKIKQYVIQNKSRIVLDIHSYPNDSISFGLIDGKIPDIVLLDSFNGGKDSLTNSLASYLNKRGVLVSVLAGGDNDISVEMRELNIASILIEFNEGLTDSQLQKICVTIASFISTSVVQR